MTLMPVTHRGRIFLVVCLWFREVDGGGGELSYACPISFGLTTKVASKNTLYVCMQGKSALLGGGEEGGRRECIAR